MTEEFHPGFRNSVASYTVSLLDGGVMRDLRLAEHGLRIVERPYANFLPLPGGDAFRFGGAHTEAGIACFAPNDLPRWADYNAMLERVLAALRRVAADGFAAEGRQFVHDISQAASQVAQPNLAQAPTPAGDSAAAIDACRPP